MTRLIMYSTEAFETARIRIEKERARKARARASWPSSQKSHHESGRQDGLQPYSVRPFVMWDGEASQDTGYCLFASSLGHQIYKPRLTTEDCFTLLLAVKKEVPESIHIIFGGRYDFDEICRQSMPVDRLVRLKEFGQVTWHGFTIKAVEGKFFTLKKDGVSVTVYEIFGWSHKSYVKTLEDYHVGTQVQRDYLAKEKERRSEFLWSEIDDVRAYNQLELELGPEYMDKIREIVLDAGFNPKNWYGPSALALEALGKYKVRDYMGDVPSVIKQASQHAYIGGRFEDVRGGILGPVYSYDKNSAYMAAAVELPCLTHGKWRRGREYEPGKFALYRIRYNGTKSAYGNAAFVHPLPCRHKDDSVDWPARVEGWYWAPEAELVKDNPDAIFIESYVLDRQCQHTPFAFVHEWYRKRLFLKSLPDTNPSRRAEKAFKWSLASIYGQLARTVGWDRFKKTPPKYHQLEWAGYITSHCRAEMYRLAQKAGDKLISIATDSVTAMCPLEVDEGIELGQWEASYADRGVFFQSGVYALELDGEWIEHKARGIEEDQRTRRVPISPYMMMSAISDGTAITLKPRKRYTTIRMALNSQLDKMGLWQDRPGDKYYFGGNGKRVHRLDTCYMVRDGRVTVCKNAEEHVFSPRPVMTREGENPFEIPFSEPHLLPWKDDMSGKLDKNLIADILFIDPEVLDIEDGWIMELSPL